MLQPGAGVGSVELLCLHVVLSLGALQVLHGELWNKQEYKIDRARSKGWGHKQCLVIHSTCGIATVTVVRHFDKVIIIYKYKKTKTYFQ